METSRGRQCLVHDGYTFRPGYTLADSSVSWRCTRKTCKATVTTTAQGQVVRVKGEHDHAYDANKLARVIFRSRCKRKAVEDLEVNPTALMRSELAAMPACVDALEEKDLRNVRQSVYRVRRHAHPCVDSEAASSTADFKQEELTEYADGPSFPACGEGGVPDPGELQPGWPTGDVVVKAYFGGAQEIRRFSVDAQRCGDFLYIRQRVCRAFGVPLEEALAIAWKDDEGDLITISTDEELSDAVIFSRGGPIRLYVSVGQPRLSSHTSVHINCCNYGNDSTNSIDLPCNDSKAADLSNWTAMTDSQRQAHLSRIGSLLTGVLTPLGISVKLSTSSNDEESREMANERLRMKSEPNDQPQAMVVVAKSE